MPAPETVSVSRSDPHVRDLSFFSSLTDKPRQNPGDVRHPPLTSASVILPPLMRKPSLDLPTKEVPKPIKLTSTCTALGLLCTLNSARRYPGPPHKDESDLGRWCLIRRDDLTLPRNLRSCSAPPLSSYHRRIRPCLNNVIGPIVKYLVGGAPAL